MPSAPLITPPPNKQFTPKAISSDVSYFYDTNWGTPPPPPPSTPTLNVAANESEMRPHYYGCLQFGFRPTNRNPEPLKYRWSSRVSPPYIPCCSRPYLSEQSDCDLTKYLQRFYYSRSYTNTLRTFAVKMHLNRTKPRFLNFQKFSLYPSFNEIRTQNVV